MMLITPAIASEPYSDEAPSVRISMRSTALAGIVFRSTAAETPDADDSLTQRRPSTRISVRLALRLRSEIVVEPEPTPEPSGAKPKLPAELNLVFSEEPLTDSCWITSPIEPRPVAAISAAVIVTTGVWPATSAFLMREPVTWIASSFCTSSPVRVWADTTAGWVASTSPKARAGMPSAVIRRRKIIFEPPTGKYL